MTSDAAPSPKPAPPPLQKRPNKAEKPRPVKIVLEDAQLDEQFVKGSGNGGQKINKTSSCVVLTHVPTGIVVKCQKTRSLQQNRKEARRLLVLRLDTMVNGELSKTARKADKVRRRKSKAKQRQRGKYQQGQVGVLEGGDSDDDDDDDDDDREESSSEGDDSDDDNSKETEKENVN